MPFHFDRASVLARGLAPPRSCADERTTTAACHGIVGARLCMRALLTIALSPLLACTKPAPVFDTAAPVPVEPARPVTVVEPARPADVGAPTPAEPVSRPADWPAAVLFPAGPMRMRAILLRLVLWRSPRYATDVA